MVQDVASLLWVVNLGCIDLNQWYARCDDVDRPDYLHFDLDPAKGASFQRVLDVALIVREALDHLGMPSLIKTSGATGMHVYVPIVRGPLQKQVWSFAKELARTIASSHPKIATAEYTIALPSLGKRSSGVWIAMRFGWTRFLNVLPNSVTYGRRCSQHVGA